MLAKLFLNLNIFGGLSIISGIFRFRYFPSHCLGGSPQGLVGQYTNSSSDKLDFGFLIQVCFHFKMSVTP